MLCALCKKREANKKNTHYLTDGIIRKCLNLDGNNKREHGLYFDLSKDNAFVDFNFQRGTSVEKLESSLGRPASEQEIEKAKTVPFSVDKVFCNFCEKHFTDIETKFIESILPNFRHSNLMRNNSLIVEELILTRLFFYLQIWRTAICEETFSISENSEEELRSIILNHEKLELEQVNHYPISITYLETIGNNEEYTTNYVGFLRTRNPNIIFMNDFVIQFYDSPNKIKHFEYYGLNFKKNYKELINFKEEKLVVNIFHDKKRKEFLNAVIRAEKVSQTIKFYSDSFEKLWLKIFGVIPSKHTKKEYLETLIGKNDFSILKYSRENIIDLTQIFIRKKIM